MEGYFLEGSDSLILLQHWQYVRLIFSKTHFYSNNKNQKQKHLLVGCGSLRQGFWRLYIAVGRVSDSRSKGHEFESKPDYTTFLAFDHKIFHMAIHPLQQIPDTNNYRDKVNAWYWLKA